MTAVNTAQKKNDPGALSDQNNEVLTVYIAGQMFGIPILQVQDVLGQQRITKIPLAPPEVAGSLNLRGRVVTAIDVRQRLAINTDELDKRDMSVVVEHDNELYSLIIDKVGDVLTLRKDHFEKNPPTLDPVWLEISLGIYRLENELLVVLDVPKLLDTVHK